MVRQTPFAFELPDALSAQEPPEKRGLTRDGVRLLAADRGTGELTHARFHQLGNFLRPGDCLVFNASRTLPASLPAWLGADSGRVALQLRLARRVDAGTWSVLLLDAEEDPLPGDFKGVRLTLNKGLEADVLGLDPVIEKLWLIRFSQTGPALMEQLCRNGNPIRYWYTSSPWDLDYYQTVYAREPGSAEMPSAGRAFTWKMLTDLRRSGVSTAFLVLHAGISSYMNREFDITHPASEERYRIDAPAARNINASKAGGGRIVAVGTTVVRALESAVRADGKIQPTDTTTRLRITNEHQLKIVDGLITGFHEPEASHLDLLMAFQNTESLRRIYSEAIREKYLWHEFGDANLIL